MKWNLKKIKLSYFEKCLLSVFLFSFFLFFLTPITGDDWGNNFVGQQGLQTILNSSISMYYHWEGRFVSRLFLYFFTSHKWLWNILNASILTLFVWCCFQFLGKKQRKTVYLLPILGLLLVNKYFFGQCYLWLAGNMTYLVPAVLSIFVFTYFYKKQDQKFSLLEVFIFCILSFLIPMFVENIGCAYVMGLFFLLIYQYYKTHKISSPTSMMFLLSCISLIVMLKSPGSAHRMQLNLEFEQMNLIEKICTNIPNLIRYTFTANAFILIFMMIPVTKFLSKKIKNHKGKPILLGIWNLIPILSILQNIQYMIPINLENHIQFYKEGIFFTSNWYFIFYWIGFGIFFLLSIFEFIKEKEEAWFYFGLTLVGVISMLVMLLTPTWGERVSCLFIFLLLITTIKIISNLEFHSPKSDFLLKFVLAVVVVFTMGCAIVNKAYDMRREQQIQSALKKKQTEIVLQTNLLNNLWNYEPWVEFHRRDFKRYYKIPEETKVTLKVPTLKQWLTYLVFGAKN